MINEIKTIVQNYLNNAKLSALQIGMVVADGIEVSDKLTLPMELIKGNLKDYVTQGDKVRLIRNHGGQEFYIAEIIGRSPSSSASDISYDNTESGLYAIKVQDAIDEVNEKADSAFQSASNGKEVIKTAITGKDESIIVPEDTTFQQLADCISQIETGVDTSDATATAEFILANLTAYINNIKVTGTMPNRGSKTFTPNDSEQSGEEGYYSGITVNPRPSLSGDASVGDVLEGKTFYGNDYIKKTGTIIDRGTINHNLPINGSFTIPSGKHSGSGKVTQSISTKGAQTYTPGTADQSIDAGQYLSGKQTIKGDANLISANIKAGKSIFGVAGNSNVVDTSAGDALASHILSGKKAYVDGSLVTGNIPSKGAQTYTPGTANQTIDNGQYLSGIQTILGDPDLIPANILQGKNIFGVAGSALAGISGATGLVNKSAATKKFWRHASSSLSDLYYVEVSGLNLSAKPTVIIVRPKVASDNTVLNITYTTMYQKNAGDYPGLATIRVGNDGYWYSDRDMGDYGDAYIGSTGFLLPVFIPTKITQYEWIALNLPYV